MSIVPTMGGPVPLGEMRAVCALPSILPALRGVLCRGGLACDAPREAVSGRNAPARIYVCTCGRVFLFF